MAKTVAASLIPIHMDYANALIHDSTNKKKLRVPTSVAHIVFPNLSHLVRATWQESIVASN